MLFYFFTEENISELSNTKRFSNALVWYNEFSKEVKNYERGNGKGGNRQFYI